MPVGRPLGETRKSGFYFFWFLICSVFLKCCTCGVCAESRSSDDSGLLTSARHYVTYLPARSDRCGVLSQAASVFAPMV